jgi:hypothetical protein
MTDKEHKHEHKHLSLADLPPAIQGHITKALKGARSQIVEVGESDPVILVYGEETVVVDARVGDNADKNRLAFAVRELVKLNEAHTVVHIHEMWTLPESMSTQRKIALMEQYGAISRMPERVEGLMVNIECRDGQGWMARAEIRRKGRAVTLSEPIIDALGDLKSGGRFAGWFAPEKPMADLSKA